MKTNKTNYEEKVVCGLTGIPDRQNATFTSCPFPCANFSPFSLTFKTRRKKIGEERKRGEVTF